MPRRAAILTQADFARAIRAARQEGLKQIEVKPDGGIIFQLTEIKEESTEDLALAEAYKRL